MSSEERETFFLWSRLTEGRKLYGEGNCTPGQRRRGRPKINWQDNIIERTGLKGHCLLRSGEERKQWRKIVDEAVDQPSVDYDWTTATTARTPGGLQYPCGKFGDCSFSRFVSSIVRTRMHTDRQTDRQTHRHTRVNVLLRDSHRCE